MLGGACVDVLSRNRGFTVDRTDRQGTPSEFRIDARHDTQRVRDLITNNRYDLVINAIGVLRDAIAVDDDESLRDALLVNAVFPHELAMLAAASGSRLVHISTDAVFAGRSGAPFDEATLPAPLDPYAAGKWLGEPWSRTTLTVRCSIVGRRPMRSHGLIAWFKALPPGARVRGYRDYRWTAATAPQVATLMGRLAEPEVFDSLRAISPVFHFAPNPPITKWEMIDLLNGFRNRDVEVEQVDHPTGPVDLSLTTRFDVVRQLSAEPRPWPVVLLEVWQ
jgi:dTDP-4-dehydrorhamnose reductase